MRRGLFSIWRRAAVFGLVVLIGLSALKSGPAPRLESSSDLPAGVRDGVVEAMASGREEIDLNLAFESDAPDARRFAGTGGSGLSRAVRQIEEMGGRVLARVDEAGFLSIRFPARKVPSLTRVPGLKAISLNRRATVSSGRALTDAAGTGLSAESRREAAELNLKAIRQPQFRLESGADGGDAVIAIIDTGVDLGHPDLYFTSHGDRKIIDYQDFTGEGDVETDLTVRPRDGKIATPFGEYEVGPIVTRSGRFHFGVFREEGINPRGKLSQDINRNGSKSDYFGVLVADTTAPGIYDTVLVDTNGDRRFSDEKPLRVYRESRSSYWFGTDDPATPVLERNYFAVTSISPAGNRVNLGFDGNGHGTYVAALAAANHIYDGGMDGVAPGARIMALKALDSSGDGGWESISRAMVYAAEHGADVISVSVEGDIDNPGGSNPESLLIERISRSSNALFVLAAGNRGPGVSSTRAPGGGPGSLVVGAYMSPEMWKVFSGYDIQDETMMDFSAVGPTGDGLLSPNLVGPAAALSAVPRWQEGSGYLFNEGTSMAVPYVAGAAADLISAARKANLPAGAGAIKRALELGARPLYGYQVIEQGHGALDLAGAWRALPKVSGGQVTAFVALPGFGGWGLQAREFRPGRIPYVVNNPGDRVLRLDLQASTLWLRPRRSSLTLPPGLDRTLEVDYALPLRPGLYSGLVTGDDLDSGSRVLELLNVVIQPWEFNEANNWRVNLSETVEPARYRRYFFRVPEGVRSLDVTLKIPRDGQGTPLGRARFLVTRPDGKTVYASEELGLGAGETSLSQRINFPAPGTWEVDVYGSPLTARSERRASFFGLEAALAGVVFSPSVIRIAVPPGQTGPIEREVTVANRFGDFSGRAEASGLVPAGNSTPAGPPRATGPFDGRAYGIPLPELITLVDGQVETRPLPPVEPGAALLRVSLANPSSPGGIVELVLYRYDDSSGEWREVASSKDFRNPAQVIEVPSPPPGRYLVFMSGSFLPGGQAAYEFSSLTVRGNAGTGLAVEDSERRHPSGDKWKIKLKMNVPDAPGRYYGDVFVRNGAENLTLGLLPVILEKGKPVVIANLLPRILTSGEPGWVTLEFRDSGLGVPVSPTVEINGATYIPRDGKLTFPVAASLREQKIKVVINDPSFSYTEQVLSIPVRPRLPEAPDPLKPDPEMVMLQKKLQSELR